MRISPISNSNYKQNFGSLIIKDGAEHVLNKLTLDELKQLKQWEKELENTKEFNLSLNPYGHRLFIKHEHKTNPQKYDSEGPLSAGQTQQGKVLMAAGVDLLDCGDWFWYNLVYKTKERAKEVQSDLIRLRNNYNNNKTVFNDIKWAVQGIKYMEEGFGHNIENAIEKNKNNPDKHSILDNLILQKEMEANNKNKIIIENISEEKTKITQREKDETTENKTKEETFFDRMLAKIGLQRIKK